MKKLRVMALMDEELVPPDSLDGVSDKQMLDWTDGRNNSTIRSLSWSSFFRTLTFTTTVAAGANGLQTMLPTQGPSGTLNAITRSGSAVPSTAAKSIRSNFRPRPNTFCAA